jgi:membrane-associated phospholipid phosphatase
MRTVCPCTHAKRCCSPLNQSLAKQLALHLGRTMHWHPTSTTLSGMAVDGIHPSPEGYGVLGRCFEPAHVLACSIRVMLSQESEFSTTRMTPIRHDRSLRWCIHSSEAAVLRNFRVSAHFVSSPERLQDARSLQKVLVAVGLALLAVGLALNGPLGRDLLIWVHESPGMPEAFWASLTVLGSGWVLISFATALDRRNTGVETLGALLCLVLAGGLINFIKSTWPMPRPGLVLEEHQLTTIGDVISHSGSMPSAHAAAAGALLAIAMLTLQKRSLLTIVVLIALIVLAKSTAWSRVAVGAHWPADILIGMSIGLLSAQVCLTLARRLCLARQMRSSKVRRWRLLALCAVELVCAWLCFTADTGQRSAWLMQDVLGLLALASCIHRMVKHRGLYWPNRAPST